MNFERVVIILRSASGGGKSTFAEYLCNFFDDRYGCAICSADDYFISEDGSYNWKAEEIGKAHEYCRDYFRRVLKEGVELVIVANTNTTDKELGWYQERAQRHGYMVFSLVVENRHRGVNKHNVPEQTLQKQANNIKSSLKLL